MVGAILRFLAPFLGMFLQALVKRWDADGVDDQFRAFAVEVVKAAERYFPGAQRGDEKYDYSFDILKMRALALGKTMKKSTINAVLEAALIVAEDQIGKAVK